jgi:hypothetical protein
MKRTKKKPEIKMGSITMGPFKKVTYYQANMTGPDSYLEIIAEVGRKVITQAEYVNIGMNHILTNMIDNKFDLTQKLQGKKK